MPHPEDVSVSSFEIPEDVISATAAQIHAKTNKDYQIPVVGVPENLETPQVFEIMPFEQIDQQTTKFYAIDGSRNSHTFYNGVSLCFYQAGYVCFQNGRQLRLNSTDDPIVSARFSTGIICSSLARRTLSDIYDECLGLGLRLPPCSPSSGIAPKSSSAIRKISVISNRGNSSRFLSGGIGMGLHLRHRSERWPRKTGDIVLRDGPLAKPNIKQRFLAKLGHLFSEYEEVRLVGITKQSPIKTELAYTYSKTRRVSSVEIKAQLFRSRRWTPRVKNFALTLKFAMMFLNHHIRVAVATCIRRRTSTAVVDVGSFSLRGWICRESLQNYDWLICDLNIYDCIPGIANKDLRRDTERSRRHVQAYRDHPRALRPGYPYPLVEAHNLVTLTGDFKQQVIARVKAALYSSQQMDHTDIENLFLDLHSRF